MAKSNTGSAKRFGVRYGRSNRLKVATAERQYKNKGTSPITGKEKGVKRIAAGIYVCKKTGVKFAGRAYSPRKSGSKEA